MPPDMGGPPRTLWTASVIHPGSKVQSRPKLNIQVGEFGETQSRVPRKSLPGSTVQESMSHFQVLLAKRWPSAPLKITLTHSAAVSTSQNH